MARGPKAEITMPADTLRRLDMLASRRGARLHERLQRLHCEWAIGAVKVRTGPGVFYVGEATSLSLTGGRDGDEYTVTITVATVPDDLSYPSDGAFEVHQ